MQKEDPRISERENEDDISETLMQTHNEVLNTLQSRLTKLQVKFSSPVLFFLSLVLFSSYCLIFHKSIFLAWVKRLLIYHKRADCKTFLGT